MKDKALFQAILLAFLLTTLSISATALANPSATWCAEQGYEYQIVTATDGSQSGLCISPTGESCSGWAYYYKCTYTADLTNEMSALAEGCSMPCPVDVLCSDSDGGRNFYQKGTIKANFGHTWLDTFTDKCVMITSGSIESGSYGTTDVTACPAKDACHVAEYFINTAKGECTGEKELYNCPYGCEDGACIELSDNYCDESDDGKDYYTKGWARDHGEYTSSWDECIDRMILQEQFCVEGSTVGTNRDYRDTITYTCPNGCEDGACVKEEPTVCRDTDGGQDFYTKGTISGDMPDNYIATDKCVDPEGRLREVYCSNNYGTSYLYDCPYGCNDGACIKNEPIDCNWAKGCCNSNADCPSTAPYCVKSGASEGPKAQSGICNRGITGDYCDKSEGSPDCNPGLMCNLNCDDYNDLSWCSEMLSNGDETIYHTNSKCGSCYEVENICTDKASRTCTDTDNGNDMYTKGTACRSGSDSGLNMALCRTDSCMDTNTLYESYCDDSFLRTNVIIECPNGCKDGACIRETPEDNKFRNAYWQCYDGREAYEGGPTSCKSTTTWKQYAEEHCENNCKILTSTTDSVASVPARCGVNTFEVWNPCTDVFDCHRSLGKEKCIAAGGRYDPCPPCLAPEGMACAAVCNPTCICKEEIVYCEVSPYDPDCVCRNGDRVPVYDDYPCDGEICPMIAVQVKYKCVDTEVIKTRLGERFKLMEQWTAIVTDYNEMQVKLKSINVDYPIHTTSSSGGGAGGYTDANVVAEETVTTEVMPYPVNGYYATLVITMPGQKGLLEAHTQTQSAIASITGNVVATKPSLVDAPSASMVLRLSEGESGSAFGVKVTALTVNSDVAIFIIHREDIITCPEYNKCEDGTIKPCYQKGDECLCEVCEVPKPYCESTICPDGTKTECTWSDNKDECICTVCESVEEPICGNNICEDGEGIVCRNICKDQPSGIEICELQKFCYIACPEDCSDEPPVDCDGCVMGTRCMPYGTRRAIDDASVFCDLDGDWAEQLEESKKCENSYECLTNTCSSGKCFDLEGELKETQGMLRKILDWLGSLFG